MKRKANKKVKRTISGRGVILILVAIWLAAQFIPLIRDDQRVSAQTSQLSCSVTQLTDSINGGGNLPSSNSGGNLIAFNSTGDFTGGNPDNGWEVFLYDISTSAFTLGRRT